jgi:uncharacterized Tic20 family protein
LCEKEKWVVQYIPFRFATKSSFHATTRMPNINNVTVILAFMLVILAFMLVILAFMLVILAFMLSDRNIFSVLAF